MPKQHVEDLNVANVPLVAWAADGLRHGVGVRVLSKDADTGAFTGVLELPAGYRSAAALECSAEMQWLVLDGEISIGDERLRAGSYCYQPACALQAEWHVRAAARVFAIFSGTPAFRPASATQADARAIANLDTWALEWIDPLKASDPSRPFRPGVMVKLLREDPVTGASTHLAGLMPGWYMPGMEVHPVYEENFCLSGDVHLGEIGDKPGYTMTVGSYLCRPPGVPHGPLVSKNGNVNLTYCHGRLGIEYRDNPRSAALIDRHLTHYRWN